MSDERFILKNARYLAARYMEEILRPGDIAVDATMGNGKDTQFLCELVGETGHVYAFDVQEEALERTAARLEAAGLRARATLILAGHETMRENVPVSPRAVMFNLGWLPGGDHTVFTHADSTIAAIEAGLKLLRKDGVMCVSIYYGGASGYEERDALLEYVRTIDPAQYTVLVTQFANRAGDPPIPVFIHKAT